MTIICLLTIPYITIQDTFPSEHVCDLEKTVHFHKHELHFYSTFPAKNMCNLKKTNNFQKFPYIHTSELAAISQTIKCLLIIPHFQIEATVPWKNI